MLDDVNLPFPDLREEISAVQNCIMILLDGEGNPLAGLSVSLFLSNLLNNSCWVLCEIRTNFIKKDLGNIIPSRF